MTLTLSPFFASVPYALMTALLPATATVIGIIVLWQLPTALDIAGVSLVISAIAIHKSPGR